MTKRKEEENQAELQTFTKQNLRFLTFKSTQAKDNIEVGKGEDGGVWRQKTMVPAPVLPTNFMV